MTLIDMKHRQKALNDALIALESYPWDALESKHDAVRLAAQTLAHELDILIVDIYEMRHRA